MNAVVEISYWQQRKCFELHGTNFPVWWLFLVFISFSFLWIVFVRIICFKLVPFLRAIMGSVSKVFLQLWFACNMCHCFVRTSYRCGNPRLYVTDKDIHRLSWLFCWFSSCFRSSSSTFGFYCMTTTFLYLLLTNCSISFLEWLQQSWNVEHIHRIWSAWG